MKNAKWIKVDTGIALKFSHTERRIQYMNNFVGKDIPESKLEQINGSGPSAGDFVNWFKFGEGIGRWLAHQQPGKPEKQPFCYNYGPAYPAPVLPCR